MKRAIAILAFAALAAGCRAQVPPATSYQVNLTWTAPAASSNWGGCTAAAPCVYSVWRAAASGTTCPAFSSTAWAEITTAATRPSATAYTDGSAAGLDVCYAVETVQGTANSGPSNTWQTSVPGTPGAAGGLSGTQAAMAPILEKLQPMPGKALAMAAPMGLR